MSININLTKNWLVYAWAVMLLAGNVGHNLSYGGALPGGLLVAWLTGRKAIEVDNG